MPQISYSSWHASFYRWFYALDRWYKMPKSLCPYFWKMLIAFVLVVPCTLCALPWLIIRGLYNKYAIDDDMDKDPLYCEAFYSICVVFGIALVVNYFYAAYVVFFHTHRWEHLSDFAQVAFVVISIVEIVLTIKFLIANPIQRYANRETTKNSFSLWCKKNGKEPKMYQDEDYFLLTDTYKEWMAYCNNSFWKLAGEAIHAWYKKHCPIIEWH